MTIWSCGSLGRTMTRCRPHCRTRLAARKANGQIVRVWTSSKARPTISIGNTTDERSKPIGRVGTALAGERVDPCDTVVVQVAQLVPDDAPQPEGERPDADRRKPERSRGVPAARSASAAA